MNRSLIVVATFALSAPVLAEDLLQVVRDAKGFDAQYAGARQVVAAGREKQVQGRAGMLPTVNFTASATQTKADLESQNPALLPNVDGREYRTNVYTLSLTQPIYRRQNWVGYEQGDWQARQAEAAFGQAEQDLLLRVTQAYFDVLLAQDALSAVQAQKSAIAEQLAQARRNFEVGTATITDTHEAQARFDLAGAQEIVAKNDLDTKRRALVQVTGKEYAGLKPLKAQLEIAPPNPDAMPPWVELAEKQNFAVQQQQAGLEIATLEAKRQSGGHHPTLDLVATRSLTNQTGSLATPVGSDISSTAIGLQLLVPIYAGGGVSSRAREAAALMEKARSDLEQARRTAALSAQQAYLATVSGVAQVKALEQALRSSQSALESNRLGYQVGVRINIDVLNAQQQLYSTQRDLAAARINALIQQLRLKAAAASLREEDLAAVNAALGD